jgi:spore maturation protein CgeB
MCVSKQDLEYFGGDVGFIGTFEKERYESMLYLARHDIKVRVWGWGWDKYKKIHPNLVCEGRPLYADDLVKAINSFRINLGFLRKINRDLQTTRSVEIPGCGAFMLAERTTEHLEMFKEGFEAEFFASDDELLKKIKKYLLDDEGRQRIASGGLRRCIESGYRNVDRMASALKVILETRK